MKKFLEEFKAFISKGNVMTMAVGIIIGSAFTAIVNSVVADIITPIIGLILGGINFSGICFTIRNTTIMFGQFIQATVTFFITALLLFFVMKAFNAFQKKKEEEPPKPSKEEELLTEIRDLLRDKQ